MPPIAVPIGRLSVPPVISNPTAAIGSDLLKPHDTGPFAPPSSSVPSPFPAASFSGLGYAEILSSMNGNWIPPDTNGTVGLNYLMVTLNGEIKIQNRRGNELYHVSLSSFWSSIYQANFNAKDYAFDPRICYDPYGQRWIITACSSARLTNSRTLIGISQTSDPTQNWDLYSIPAKSFSNDNTWSDFDQLGFNKNWIAVSVNKFALPDGPFQGTVVYILNKATLYTNHTLSYTSAFQSQLFAGSSIYL